MAQDEHGYARVWLEYLADHRQRGLRVLHYGGTGAAVLMLVAAVVGASPWLRW